MLWMFRNECLIIDLAFSLWISLLLITLNSKKEKEYKRRMKKIYKIEWSLKG